MKKYFILALFGILLSLNSNAAPPTNPVAVPTMTVGGVNFTNLKNLIVLYMTCKGAALYYSSGRLAGTSAGYAVPASKSLRVLAVRANVGTGGAGTYIIPMYSDNDLGAGTLTAPTNPIFLGGSGPANSGFLIRTLTAGVTYEAPTNFVIPTGKYPGVSGDGSAYDGQVSYYGYLE
jgi:hypothetical protein